MKRLSASRYNRNIEDIFTKEVYERLKAKESFRMNLETMQLETLPEVVTIPRYDVVIYGIKIVNGIEVVCIHDFLDVLFEYKMLDEPYEKVVEYLKKELTNNQ